MADRRPSPRSYPWQPLTMTWPEVAAAVFRRSESWLRDHLQDYPDFPQPDPKLAVFATEAVEAWVRRRFGLAAEIKGPEDAERILLERLSAKHQGPVSRRTAA